MKTIKKIDKKIDKLKKKLDIGAKDWTPAEKGTIEECYFEITKVSVGFGRTVDLGCDSCVDSAVSIIKNYIKMSAETEEESTDEWKETVATIKAKAKELGLAIPKAATTKADKLEAVENFITSQSTEDEEDLLGPEGDEQTEAQLIAIIKAKTGEAIEPGEHTLEELKAFAESEDSDEEE